MNMNLTANKCRPTYLDCLMATTTSTALEVQLSADVKGDVPLRKKRNVKHI